MISKRTEKAIREWLDVDSRLRAGSVVGGAVRLWHWHSSGIVVRFTLASVIAKRYPKRKKKKL